MHVSFILDGHLVIRAILDSIKKSFMKYFLAKKTKTENRFLMYVFNTE
jgi:uncharacterized protein YpiB (UPF0302 family)